MTETKRTVGRPASFPATVVRRQYLKNLPIATIAMVKELSERRGQNQDFTLNQIIERAYKEANRKRSKKS